MRLRVTPVPIPNTMVKTQAADGTSLETVRESRWPPGYKKLKNTKQIRCKCSGDSYRYRQKMSNNLWCQPYQQGSAVMIAGFTSD